MIIFFFSNDMNNFPLIKESFRLVCANKLLSDMYCDMEEYIAGRIDKKDMLQSLLAMESPVAELYKKPYPTPENVRSMWSEVQIGSQLDFMEAKAVVNWLYRTYANIAQRKDATKTILHSISDAFALDKLAFADSIIYVESRVQINIISSFDDFCKAMQEIDSPKHTFYYRGHSDSNYVLLPSIMRKSNWLLRERDMYNELLIECSQDFDKCSTHLDYLVHMQHYGLPTRLLDVTKNPLVALYFACESHPTKKGEVIVFNADREKIKYPGSDTATVLASLPLFDKELKDEYAAYAANSEIDQADFNKCAERLLHEVKLEKPAFKDEIRKADILDCFFVLSEKRNNRIIKQDGAFIICGLIDEKENPINQYRYVNQEKIQVFIIEAKKKKSILQLLDKFSINKAWLFPEISDVTEYIKEKY